MLLNDWPFILTGPHALTHSFLQLSLPISPQTKVTVTSSPGVSKRKDKATSMSSFSTHPRRSLSVFSNQAPTWRGPQGKATGRPSGGHLWLLPGLGSGDGLGATRLWGLYLSLRSWVGSGKLWAPVSQTWKDILSSGPVPTVQIKKSLLIQVWEFSSKKGS